MRKTKSIMTETSLAVISNVERVGNPNAFKLFPNTTVLVAPYTHTQ